MQKKKNDPTFKSVTSVLQALVPKHKFEKNVVSLSFEKRKRKKSEIELPNFNRALNSQFELELQNPIAVF